MSQQEYQRRFAMLRPFQSPNSSMAGFARFELRAGRGRVTVSVQGIRNGMQQLHAALIGGDETHPAVCDCGSLIQTKNGQGGLCYEFDPSDVGGVPFERCHTCIITANDAQDAQVLLCGVFGKCSLHANWETRRRALRALWYPQTADAVQSPAQLPDAGEKPAGEASDEKDDAETMPQDSREEEMPEGKSGLSEKTQQDVPREEMQTPQEPAVETGAPIVDEEPLVHICAEPVRAAAWQGHAYGLKPMFEKYPQEQVFDQRGDVFFVRVPMTVETEIDHYLLGAHVRDEKIDAVCVAIPGRYAPQAPAGLMGAVFAEVQDHKGYWFSWQDGYTGRPLDLPWPWQEERKQQDAL